MFKKIISLLAIPIFIGSTMSVITGPSAYATTPTLTWAASPLPTTNNLGSITLSLISGDGLTKMQVSSTSTASAYASRNGGSWNLATGLSALGYVLGGAVDNTGEHIVLVGSAMGGLGGSGSPKVAVSSNYGASFTVLTPYSDSSSRMNIKVSISPDGRTMIIGSYFNPSPSTQTTDILTSNDFGATWSYKTLGAAVLQVAAVSASYLGAGKNVVYAMDSTGLIQHVFSSSDSSAISGNLDSVVGSTSPDTIALVDVREFGISRDGTHAVVTTGSYGASIKNVTIGSDGKWGFSSAVTPTYSPSTPTSLVGSNSGQVGSLAISDDGLVIAFSFTNYGSFGNGSSSYFFTSQDAGATFGTPISNITNSNLSFNMTADGVELYLTVSSAAKYSSSSGLSFGPDIIQYISNTTVTNIAGSADGSVMFFQSGGVTSPPVMLLSRDFGATAASFNTTGGASSTYPIKAYVSTNGTKAIFENRYYSSSPASSLKEFYGTNFGSSRNLNLPAGVTSLQSAAFSPDLSAVLIADGTTSYTGKLFYGTIADGVVTWSSALGDTTTYGGLAVTPAGFYAISSTQSKLFSATITNGVAGTLSTNSTAFSNGFSGTWSPISSSSNGRYLAVTNYGSLSSNCYAGGYVYKSDDFGATWAVIPSGASSAQVGAVSMSADGSIISFGTASGGYMKVSTDGGATFADQTSLGSFTCSGQMGSRIYWYAPFIYVPAGADFGIAVSSSTSVLNTTSYAAVAPSLSAQTISFTNPAAMTVGDADQTLTVSASSSLTVALTTADSAICTIVSGKAHAVAAGTCSITAAQAGDSSYSAATSVTKTLTISAAAPILSAQTISFTNPAAMTVGDADQTLTVTASSSLAVALTTADSAICTIVSGKAHAVAAGTCSITASQAGDSSYSAATSVTKTLTISAAAPSQSEQQIAAAAAEAARQVAIVKAKESLQGILKVGTAGTLAQYKEADYSIANEDVLTRVNAALLKLSATDRVKSSEILKVIKVESFIVQISTSTTQKSVTTQQLISVGLIAANNPNKVRLTAALKDRTASTLDSLEKIAAAIAEETAFIKARAARLAALKVKVSSRKG